ncbi:hypothetical protein CHS0354_016194 [Potamilus streckersoni]|uniref:Uncharacterized protein n=1 Tax=Potamilus streckersoni TaxID=2493646 RepID=A0AAE0RXW8_9BIVA|nr:hypothetical protein CHS0354_016194 [Potamilus streckersoni]
MFLESPLQEGEPTVAVTESARKRDSSTQDIVVKHQSLVANLSGIRATLSFVRSEIGKAHKKLKVDEIASSIVAGESRQARRRQ